MYNIRVNTVETTTFGKKVVVSFSTTKVEQSAIDVDLVLSKADAKYLRDILGELLKKEFGE